MLAAAIIVFREVIEAGLIVGIVMAATRGVPTRMVYISGGILVGILAASLLAAFAGTISNMLEGAGEEVFNACILGFAVIMLAWHNIWMAQHGRELAAELKAAGQAVATGSKTLMALAVVVGIAVLREGAEVVLFLYGIVVASGESALSLFAGGVMGLMAGAAVSGLTYAGLITIPARYLFSVTTFLITFLAAGMASQCVSFLEQGNLLNLWSDTLWDTSFILASDSLLGRILHTLVGYDDKPTILQAVVYLATLSAFFLAMRIFSSGRPSQTGRGRAATSAGAA